MKVFFLGAAVPLTKTISKQGKEPYPNVANFTSYAHDINTVQDLHTAIVEHAKKNHCLIKGHLHRPLTNESRKGATKGDDLTQWICLDFDRFETDDVDAVLNSLGLGKVDYVIQYTSSHGLPEHEGTLSAHVFMLLSKPLPAPQLKAWLMDRNLTLFDEQIELSRAQTTLRWPLDITTCQNDKLLYIAPPLFRGLPDPMGKNPRIQYVKRGGKCVDVSKNIGEMNLTVIKNTERKTLNDLRVAAGLPRRSAKTTWIGTVEVENKPDGCTVTSVKEDDDHWRLNLNGGDSWAYLVNKNNPELIYDFKSDTWSRTKEKVPEFYRELMLEQEAVNATPTEDGDLILGFRDPVTAQYYNGTWNPELQKLTLYSAKNETQIAHWYQSHGRAMGDFIPIWNIGFHPREDWIVDEDARRINTFRMSPYMRAEPRDNTDFPRILRLIKHVIGYQGPEDDALLDHFINWFACIFQRRERPITAWVFHGIEGTGKGYFFHRIVRPLLEPSNTMSVTVGNLEDSFNGWAANKLFIFVDEVDVDDFREKGRVAAKLRNAITDQVVSVRHMRQTASQMDNWACWLFASNRPQPVHIPESDRRYNVGNFQDKKLVKPDEKDIENELEAFAQFLLAHRADVQQASQIIHTEARERIKALGISSLVETCRSVQKGDFEALWYARPNEERMLQSQILNEHTQNAQAYCILMKEYAKAILEGDLTQRVTRDELLIILQYNVGNMPKTPNKFTSLLRHNNITLGRIRKNNELCYGLDVKWTISSELKVELLRSLKQSKPALKKVS